MKFKPQIGLKLNYIAHIHIANHTQTSLLGNFLGDFVKGNPSAQLPKELANGVLLHRNIDTFTDSHPLVCALRQKFPKPLRRMSGVIIDIAFDQCLMSLWHEFTDHSRERVLDVFYQQLSEFDGLNTSHFRHVQKSLLSDKWLIHYQALETCLRAFNSIERRLNYKIEFAQLGYQFLLEQQPLITSTFCSFYPDLLAHAIHCNKKIEGQ